MPEGVIGGTETIAFYAVFLLMPEYLVPLFGVIWAWVFLGEPLTLSMAVAGALILGGVALSQQRARPAAK